jgi:tRNA(adenine34) deaminase
MRRALALAEAGAAAGEVPVGAVLVRDGAVLGEGFNRPIGDSDPSAHAEMVALRAAARSIGNYRLAGTTLYVTMEPCVMCAGAIVHARVARLVFGAEDPKWGGCASVFRILEPGRLNHDVIVKGGVLAAESASLLQRFFKARRSGAVGGAG